MAKGLQRSFCPETCVVEGARARYFSNFRDSAPACMNDEAKQFLFRLLNTPSPSGFETEAQKVCMKYASRFAHSEQNDTYETACATFNGRNPEVRVMLEAHA